MVVDYSNARSVEQARYQALAKGWPALYVALSADIIAVALVHAAYVPWWASTILPAILVPKALIWAYLWHRKRNEIPSSEDCARSVRTLGVEVTLWMAVIVCWQVSLSYWGTPQSQLLLALCMGGQMVFLLFGLLHLRAASIISAAFCAAGLLFVGSGIGPAVIGIVVLLVGGVAGLAHVAHGTYQDFTSLVVSRLSLQRKADEIEALSETNFRLANTDMLTEIGNRRRFFHDLKATLEQMKKNGGQVALGIIDLDGFKAINDSNGHLVGDRLLQAMAERLQEVLVDQGEVYRLGGDEFAFIIAGTCDDRHLLDIGERVIKAVHAPIRLGELRLVVGCSIGFAAFPDKADNETDLYDRADYALFAAKRTGRFKAVVFNEEHERAVRETARIERTLRAADLEEEFYLTFQPIVDSSNGKTLLLECLARWQSPTLGAVSPGQFIVVAEQSGFISTLTPMLLKKALFAVGNWPDDVGISFNLSGHDITAQEKVMNLIAIIERSGISPKRIEFEVTETALMMNIDSALANIHLLKAAGVRIALDDFGTGYSSLSQIQKLPLDKIKVDGSFVRDLASSKASQKIVRSVSALSRDLALSCVVEGVETREQLDILQDIGCHLIQGYYYSRPMPEAQVGSFLAELATSTRARAALAATALAFSLSSACAQDVVLRQTGTGEVHFVGRSFALPIVSGSFEQIDCKVSVDLKNLEASRISVTIATGSLRSLIGIADGFVKGPHLLDAAHHPQMSFVSHAVYRIDDNRYRIDGFLTIKGITRPISLQAVVEGDMMKAGTGAAFPFTATTSVSRAAFDIGRDINVIDDRLEISVTGRLT